ncbi:MAG: FKBP-type peptidyl-prolyl cis-trans isomerase [Wenzhouxiangella sp.]
MQIKANTVVSIDYTLTGDNGEVIDTSQGREPLVYLHGHGHIIPGLERAIEGRTAGEELSVSVQPEDGYGPYRDELVQEVPRSAFDGVEQVEPGMSFRAESAAGPMTVTVREVGDETVTVDANHSLAGQVLNFEVAIKSVREASAAEQAEGAVGA